MKISPKIDALFAKTKSVCFGRFVMDVPVNTDLIFGGQAFGPNIQTLENSSKNLRELASSKQSELEAIKHREEAGSLLRLAIDGPTEGSRVLQFWSSRNSTYTTDVWGYLSVPPHGFLYKGLASPIDGRPLDGEMQKLTYVATNLRVRQPDEVPSEPGVCLDLGFIKDDTGKFQEIFNIGLRFPSLPDVSFSISTNKDARRDTSFEERRNEAKKAALAYAPLATLFGKVKTLREGKHEVFRWKGDEALFRRPLDGEQDGVWHEFQFEYLGIRYDHHNPGWEATLFTGVKGNTAGGQAASLTDDEVIALWDRLLSTFRLRVPD